MTIEDHLDDLHTRVRHSMRTSFLAVQLVALALVVRWADRHFYPKGI